MILNGCTLNSGAIYLSPCYRKTRSSRSRTSMVPQTFRPIDTSRSFCTRGIGHGHLSAASTPLLHVKQGGLKNIVPVSPKWQQVLWPIQASKDVPYSYRFPAMTEKPKWWWRTLACLPYLIPLHKTWIYAETTYNLYPFFEKFEFLTYPFLRAVERVPVWVQMACAYVVYLGVVKRKEWPHFLRFHVVMGILLESALQVAGQVNSWVPLCIYWGKIGMHFWTAFGLAYLLTVLECIWCALAGMYPDVPFICDAAYIHTT